MNILNIKSVYVKTWLILNVLDLLLSLVLITLGMGIEANPLIVLGEKVIILKLVGAIAAAKFFGKRDDLMKILCFGMGMVVNWNLFVLAYSLAS